MLLEGESVFFPVFYFWVAWCEKMENASSPSFFGLKLQPFLAPFASLKSSFASLKQSHVEPAVEELSVEEPAVEQ